MKNPVVAFWEVARRWWPDAEFDVDALQKAAADCERPMTQEEFDMAFITHTLACGHSVPVKPGESFEHHCVTWDVIGTWKADSGNWSVIATNALGLQEQSE